MMEMIGKTMINYLDYKTLKNTIKIMEQSGVTLDNHQKEVLAHCKNIIEAYENETMNRFFWDSKQ